MKLGRENLYILLRATIAISVILAASARADLPAPPELQSLSEAGTELSEFDDRVRLVNFWATWCAPCRVEMPDLDELQANYDTVDFRVIGIAGDERDSVERFLQDVPVEYPIFVGQADEVFAWTEALGNSVVGLPFSIIVDEAGSIRWVKTGGRITTEDLMPIIDELLIDPSPRQGPPIGGRQSGTAAPPRPLVGKNPRPVAVGTPAGDGIGVTVRQSATAGTYDTDTLTYVPWDDVSEVQPIRVGQKLPPDSTIYRSNGEAVDVLGAIKSKPTVLVYFRGGWCPFCNAHLREVQDSIDELTAMGYQILAVSTDTPDAVKSHETSTNFSYELLSDSGLHLATTLGLKYKASQDYIDHVRALPADRAFDLVERNGGFLVTPAAIIFDTEGLVRFVYANNNYSVRASQKALLDASREALQN